MGTFLSKVKYSLFIVTGLLLLFNINTGNASSFHSSDTVTVEDLFHLARQRAYDGETEKAREIAYNVLENNQDFHDARVLVGITLSWDGHYDSARVQLKHVLDAHTAHFDALNAIINLELWDGNYEEAVKYCNMGIDYHYETTRFLFMKARALRLACQLPLAIIAVEQVLDLYPGHREAQFLLAWYKMLYNRSILELFEHNFLKMHSGMHPELFRERSYFLAEYHGDFHDSPYERRWHMGSAGYSHYTPYGPVTAKINFAQTYFDGRGLTRYPSFQYELETYPVFSPQYYAYASYAYSGGSNFPRHRGGFELFRNLPRGFETSLGFRYIYWDENFFFYTGSIGLYHGNYWFSLRPYIFKENSGISHSVHLNVRRYMAKDGDFAGITIGRGAVPDETYAAPDRKIYLNSWTAGGELSKTFMSDYLFRAGIRYAYEEYQTGSYRGRIIVHAVLRYYLN